MTKKGKKKQQNKQNVSTSDTTSNEPSQSQSTSQQQQQQQQQQQTKPQKKTSQQSVEKPQEQVPQQQLQGAWAKKQKSTYSSQQQLQEASALQQQQQQMPTQSSQQQPQGALGRPQQQQQQMPTQPSQQQPQGALGRAQQQQQIPTQPSQQQPQGALGRAQQQQQISTQPSQQQSQGAWGHPQQQQQQMPTHPLQQQPQGASARPQQQRQQMPPQPSQQQPQGAWGRPQQQRHQMPPQASQQQPQRAWGRPQQQPQQMPPQASQQQPQGAWGHPQQQQQQMPTQPSQQQPQGAWGRPQQQQQQMPTQPSQQQPQGAWGRPQQQIPTQPSQQQPQGAWGHPQQQQQQMPTQPSQQQPQGAWGHPQQQQQQMSTQPSQQQPQGAWGRVQQQQQQMPMQPSQQQQQMPTQPSQQQPQGAWGQLHQQQREVSDEQTRFKKGDSSDAQQSQPSTSTQSLQISELSLRDTLQIAKTSSKSKMSASAMKQYQLSIPKRRNPNKGGTLGNQIYVWTNMFEILFNKNFITNAIHYDVTITPNAPKLLHKDVFEKCRKAHFGNRFPAFDGKKNAYSANDLPFKDSMETKIEIFDNERDKHREFTIALKKVAVIDLSWIKNLRPGLDEENRTQSALQVLDIVMRHAFENNFFSIGRSIFWDIDTRTPLGKGLCLGRGGFLSAIAGWKPYLNMDVAHKGFPSPKNVVDIMAEFQESPNAQRPPQTPTFTENEYMKLVKFLKNLKVIYEIPNIKNSKRTYRINGLGPTADKHKFNCDGTFISITEYFATKKGYNLQHPNLYCLWVGAKERDEKIYLPAELCNIMHQSYNRKLDDRQTTNMIRSAATDATTRKRRIEEAFKKINVNESDTMRQEFKMAVNPNMKKVEARILPPPELRYANARIAAVNKGTWQMHHFKQAENLSKDLWAIVDMSSRRPDLHGLKEKLIVNAGSVGMRIEETKWVSTLNPRNPAEIAKYFLQRKQANFKLIIVIVPSATDTTYSKVKQITELQIGILTQCIKFDTVRKIMNSENITTVKNILLKINSKLNGINHIFNKMPMCLQNNSSCMLVGADVTHPSPDATTIPSIAAVAASQDTVAFQYNAELRLQPPKEEMILDLENIIESQISVYRDKTKCLPQKIIYYRDGVSEGQLAQVMYFEIDAIRRACKKFKPVKDIEITCLVVQKRHHVRLFPTNPQESDDRNRNVKAGTIVDTEITHPNHIDFYLVSHASIQGTARPTKYRCICNDSNFTEDEIEELTYYLCHMYARCARAVSYPAPTYYAHLAAYRGRALIQGINICLNNLESEQQKLRMKLAESPMYFI